MFTLSDEIRNYIGDSPYITWFVKTPYRHINCREIKDNLQGEDIHVVVDPVEFDDIATMTERIDSKEWDGTNLLLIPPERMNKKKLIEYVNILRNRTLHDPKGTFFSKLRINILTDYIPKDIKKFKSTYFTIIEL